MKKILTLVLLFLTFVIEAQEHKTKSLFYYLNQSDNSFESPILNFKNYFTKASFYGLQVYNPSIGLLENYSFVSDNQYERKDELSLIYRNKQYINFNSACINSPLSSNRVDSFNPYGSTSIGQSIGLGLINTLLNLK